MQEADVMGDALYPLLGAAILAVIGFALVMKAGSKFGWLVVAGACVWAWFILQPAIMAARRPSAGQQGSSYYQIPKK
jgi:hypothetical protein